MIVINFTHTYVDRYPQSYFWNKNRLALDKDKFDIPKKLNRILDELQEQERSMLWLSKKTGLTYQTVFDYCHNIKQPNLVTLKVIAIVLGVKASSLIVD